MPYICVARPRKVNNMSWRLRHTCGFPVFGCANDQLTSLFSTSWRICRSCCCSASWWWPTFTRTRSVSWSILFMCTSWACFVKKYDRWAFMDTVYPRNMQTFYCVLCRIGYSVVLRRTIHVYIYDMHDCPSAREITLKEMCKWIICIPWSNYYNRNKIMQTKRYRSTYLIWHTSSCVRKFGIAFTNPRIHAKIVIAFCVNLLTDFELIGVIERRKSRWCQICGLDDAKFVVTCDIKGFHKLAQW